MKPTPNIIALNVETGQSVLIYVHPELKLNYTPKKRRSNALSIKAVFEKKLNNKCVFDYNAKEHEFEYLRDTNPALAWAMGISYARARFGGIKITDLKRINLI
jgi:hypothetical protein